MTKEEKKRFHTERCNNIMFAVLKTIKSIQEIKENIGNITPEDDYMFLELRYMADKYKAMLEGYTKAHLTNEEYQGRLEFEDD